MDNKHQNWNMYVRPFYENQRSQVYLGHHYFKKNPIHANQGASGQINWLLKYSWIPGWHHQPEDPCQMKSLDRKTIRVGCIASSGSLLFEVVTTTTTTLVPDWYRCLSNCTTNNLCLNPTPVLLFSDNGQDIQCYGEASIGIQFPGFCCS